MGKGGGVLPVQDTKNGMKILMILGISNFQHLMLPQNSWLKVCSPREHTL